MSDALFAKFNDMVDVTALQNAIEDATSSNIERKEVPFGDYEVRITKLELGQNTFEGDYNGMPEAHVWFKVIGDGEYAGQMLFMNKRLMSLDSNPSDRNRKTAFMITKFNDFLKSLETNYKIVFENWEQYGDLIEQIFNEIDGRAEYHLDYHENKGYKDFTIVKRFQ